MIWRELAFRAISPADKASCLKAATGTKAVAMKEIARNCDCIIELIECTGIHLRHNVMAKPAAPGPVAPPRLILGSGKKAQYDQME